MRRLNVKLALWLVGITVFSVVGVHFLHGYQIDRNANFLKVQAEQARTAGNSQEAIKQYNQYLRHRDDREGYQALAELVVDVAEQADATSRDKIRAYNILEEAIRRHPDLDEVRASLVDYTMLMRRFPDAQDHIALLQANREQQGKEPDPELEYKSALCHFASGDSDLARKKLCEMVGFNDNLGEFGEEAPATAKEIRAFPLLAHIMRRANDVEQADAVMQQLVKWNPESGEAHLTLGRYLRDVWRDPKTSPEKREELLGKFKAEFDEAYKLEPDNADALLEVATTSIMESDFPRAQELLDRARQEFPDRQDVYVRQAELAMAQGNKDEASEQLREGLNQAKDTRQILEQLIDVQFQQQDLAAVRKTIARMEALDTIQRELVRYQKARLKLAENNVIEAAREFEQVRPAMERLGPKEQQQVNMFLANCYELLGLPDRQLEVHRRLLDSYPNLLMARLGEAGALQALGRHAEADTSVKLLAGAAEGFPVVRMPVLRLAVAQELSKPEAERNWSQVEKVAALLYQDTSRSEEDNELLKVDLLLSQGRHDEALESLTALRKKDPKNVTVWVALCKLLANDPAKRERIPELLTLAEKEVGDVAALRIERIKAVMSLQPEDSLEQLKRLEAGIEKFDDREQRALYQQLGQAYARAGSPDDGMRCWKAAIAGDPTNGRIRQLVFELAMEREDKETIQQMLRELRESPAFGPDSPLYKYCNAANKLQAIYMNPREDGKLTDADAEMLLDLRKEIEQAIAVRPEWAPLWRLRGEIDQLEGKYDAAVAAFQRSLDYSQFNQEMTARRLVTLLHALGRYSEANEAMKHLSGSELPEMLRRRIEDTKLKAGETSTAIEMAKKDVEAHPEDPMKHVWYGRMLNTVGKSEEAEEAFRKATEVGPKLPATWELLVQRLLLSRKKNEAVAAVQRAAQSLSDDPLSMAALYELVGDTKQAGALYETALNSKPNDLNVLKRVAEFNFSANQPDKAAKFLDEIVEKGSKSSERDASGFVHWARRRKAQELARQGDYQNTLAAVELIKQNATNGQLERLDMLSVIGLLGDRPEHASRAEAIRLLEELKAAHGLSALQTSALAKLYEREGNWSKAQEMMHAAVDSRSNDPAVFSLFARMMLDHGDATEASRYIDRAEELLAKSPGDASEMTKHEMHTVRARLLIAEGKKEEAARVIESQLARPLPQNQLVKLGFLSRELEQLGLTEAAERLLDEYMSQEQRAAIAMAAFQGRQGNVDKAFDLLQEARTSQPVVEILPVAMEILRYYPNEVTPERCKLLEEWATGALQSEANPQAIQLVLAELYDLQGRYDDVEKIYRELLADPKLSRGVKARVQNNLAFLLAAVNPSPQRGAEALKLMQEAIDVIGPRADLLDTRAVAYLAVGKAEDAQRDIRIAILDDPSLAKYYHQAQIEKQLGNTDAARAAMAKAKELQNDHNPFTPAERQDFEKLSRELGT